MALISFLCAKGAPGTTTTGMLLANLWPAPSILVDADPLGGDVALRLSAEHGPLDLDRGLMSLLPAARRGLEPHVVLSHCQVAIGGQSIVAGLPGPEQAVAVAPLWPSLAAAFGRVPEHDVFADLGQVHSKSTHLAMLEQSSAALVVFRPTAWSVVHTRRRLESLEETLRARHVGVVCVATARESREAAVATESLLQGLTDWVHDYGVVADDKDAVRMYDGGQVFRPERSLLVRSGRSIVQRLYAELGPVAAAITDDPEDAETTPPSAPERPRRGSRRAGGARKADAGAAASTEAKA